MKSFIKKAVIWILTLEAKLIIRKYKPFVIAVTGSVGKTSTKDAIYSVISPHFFTRKSDKSFNSEIGVPLTILGCPNAWSDAWGWMKNIGEGLELILFGNDYPKVLILEIGADHPGDISKTASWLKPQVALLTKVGAVPVHVEFFNSREEIFNEKKSLVESVAKGGTVILYGNDVEIASIKVPQAGRTMVFGFVKSENITLAEASVEGIDLAYDVIARNYEVVYGEGGKIKGIRFALENAGSSVLVELDGVIGVQHVYPMLAAAAVGIAKGLKLEQIATGAKKHVPPRGRMNIIEGIHGSTLIDDTYNSSPDAVKEALDVLKGVTTTGRRIAVLGDMMELGKFALEEHDKAGTQAASSCDLFVTIGVRAQKMRDGAIKAGMPADMILSFDTSVEGAKALEQIVAEGDVVLIKGSQSPRLERISKALLAEPAKAKELLVRQDEEWLKR